MKTYIIAALAIMLTFNSYATDLQKITLKKVVDGDTVYGFINGEFYKLRLLDIDCYENKNNPRAQLQATYYHKSIGEVLKLGKTSQEILSSLLYKNKDNLYVELSEKDRFDRDLAYLYVGNDKEINVNQYMLSEGKCEKYISSKEMKEAFR